MANNKLDTPVEKRPEPSSKDLSAPVKVYPGSKEIGRGHEKGGHTVEGPADCKKK
jgi:hypothetical protein